MSLAPAAAPSARNAQGPTGPSSVPDTDRRHPVLVTIMVIAVLAAVLAAVARGHYRDGPLEPDAPTAQGSKAAVQVLEGLGVTVDVDRHTADAVDALDGGSTVLVTDPGRLGDRQLTALAEAQERTGGTLVLVQPDGMALSSLGSEITPVGSLRTKARVDAGPGCADLSHRARVLEIPAEADTIRSAALLYRPADGTQGCVSTEKGSLVVEDDGLVVLGSADLLTNAGVGHADNSALALNLLGAQDDLSWYVPSANDPMAATSQTPLGFLPDWAGPVVLWLLLVTVVALVALGRRFGPVVIEPLPVTVRPQELVLGRARLLQRSGSRDAAAASLRTATSIRLADRLGLHHESSLDGLIAALAPHSRRTPEQLRTLLGPTPVTSDPDLVRLAHDLDHLEKEIDR